MFLTKLTFDKSIDTSHRGHVHSLVASTMGPRDGRYIFGVNDFHVRVLSKDRIKANETFGLEVLDVTEIQVSDNGSFSLDVCVAMKNGNGCRFLTNENEVSEWLLERLTEGDDGIIVKANAKILCRKVALIKHDAPCPYWKVSGRYESLDTGAWKNKVLSGIGRNKAYGFGMIDLW